MHLGSLARRDLIFTELSVSSRDSLLRSLADALARAGEIESPDLLYQRLLEREELGSTGIGGGVAIPHCKFKNLERVLLGVGIARQPIDFDATDGQPVQLFFLVVSPEDDPTEHLKTLAAISKWVKTNDNVEQILKLRDVGPILELLNRDCER